MFDKKTDKIAKKQALTQKEEKERKKRKIVAVTICTVFVLLLSAALVLNSAFIRRALPVVTIDGVNFSTTEFEYFFNIEYMEYMEFAGQFQGMFPVPDAGRALSAQVQNEETGATWADFIAERTLRRMAEMVSLYNAAGEYGFVLSQESLDLIENEVFMRQLEANMHGWPNLNSYLQRMFGFSINEQAYREILNFVMTADSFNMHIRDSFTYTDQQLEAFYAENAESLDVFFYRVLNISADMPFEDDFEDPSDFDAATAQALDDANELASQIAEGITDEESFIIAAGEHSEWLADPAATLRVQMGEALEADLSSWLLDSSREYGDVLVTPSERGATIAYFISRDSNNYRTVTMNQILISRENVDPMGFELGEEDPEYLEAVELARQVASERARVVYELFTAGDTSVEVLIALMDEHSDDTTPEGFYENIALFSYNGTTFRSMRLVAEIEEWIFDESRALGDFEMIETAAFGYHLVIFTGLGEYFSKLMAEDRMRVADHTQWLENLSVGEPQRHGAFILVSM
ncbi:MAG: hypothetical protein FWC20_01220 [Oscillospiraceae bacterium]|nr:hypothetical protein [Oscillospiraceae bacterium]MCL2278014.1 hypothetical protein [Oscillospiraceae bacterium]